MRFDYPQEQAEIEIVQRESGLEREICGQLVRLGRAIRNLRIMTLKK